MLKLLGLKKKPPGFLGGGENNPFFNGPNSPGGPLKTLRGMENWVVECFQKPKQPAEPPKKNQ